MPDRLAVNEIFGPTFQGEGRNIGQPCLFLRLAGCNLRCVWCDSKYTWDWEHYNKADEVHSAPIVEVKETLLQLSNSSVFHLVVSGGEPMLQQKALRPLIHSLHERGWFIEIETAGTIAPIDPSLANLFNVSPKLGHSGNALAARYHADVLTSFRMTHKAIFKFVVQNPSDFAEIDQIVHDCRLDANTVYIMPEGVSEAHIDYTLQTVAHEALLRGFNLSTRLHVLLYGNRRAV